jgi:hypothetical protein
MRWRKREESRASATDLVALGLMLMSMDEKLDWILSEVRDDDDGEEEEAADRP